MSIDDRASSVAPVAAGPESRDPIGAASSEGPAAPEPPLAFPDAPGVPVADAGPTGPGLDRDVERGLRFVHVMQLEGRAEQSHVSVEVSALTDLLIAKGLISTRELDERKRLAIEQQNQRDQKKLLPMVTALVDKYAQPTPDIPCAENLRLCRAACCNLRFNLSTQDLDEGVVRWDYGAPYRIRHRTGDRKCVHFDTARRGCGIYEHRPSTCRVYDCRTDKRIWQDYDKRIPNPELAKLAPVPVVPED